MAQSSSQKTWSGCCPVGQPCLGGRHQASSAERWLPGQRPGQEGVRLAQGPAGPPPSALGAPCTFTPSSSGLHLPLCPREWAMGSLPKLLPFSQLAQPPRVPGSRALCVNKSPLPTSTSGHPVPTWGCWDFFFTSPFLPAPVGLFSLLGCWATLSDHRPDISVFVSLCQAGTSPSNRFSLHNR